MPDVKLKRTLDAVASRLAYRASDQGLPFNYTRCFSQKSLGFESTVSARATASKIFILSSSLIHGRRFRGNLLVSSGKALAIAIAISCFVVPEDSKVLRTMSRGSTAIVLYNAAAIARPMRAVLDSFAARTGSRYEQETAASLELARKVVSIGGEPDVIVLADPDVFTQMLAPQFVTWHALFARNRIVIAYSKKARFADEITSENWRRVLLRPGVEVGRADPNTDPSGYRTLLVWQLAETFYGDPGLAARLLAASPSRNVRPREAEQIVLVETGEYDYTWTYENLAQNARLRYVRLPSAIDLGAPEDSARYATATVRVLGRTSNDSVTFRGKPILFAVSIPIRTKNRQLAEQFVGFLLSDDGRRILRSQHFDALDTPVFRGQSPEALTLKK